MVQLKLTNHAQLRLHERGLSISHIKEAIMLPDFTEHQPSGIIKVRKELRENKTIEVVYDVDRYQKNTVVIITAYYTS